MQAKIVQPYVLFGPVSDVLGGRITFRFCVKGKCVLPVET